MLRYCTTILFSFAAFSLAAQTVSPVEPVSGVESMSGVDVANGWANNSINTVIFRQNSLVSYKDSQYIAFYDAESFVVIGKRKTGEKQWQLKKTIHKGKTTDAHNCISIMVDGAGYLHLSWDHHNNPLNYCRGKYPGSLELTDKLQMTGSHEQKVSYPGFYKLSDGNLFFLFRDGASGEGNLVLNRYDIKTQQWAQVQANLVDGESQRNAYWQACVDGKGVIHLSWVWRETPDVATNHDLCYARSADGGKTWTNSAGLLYKLPITASTAEYVCHVPQHSELINQTSMTTDPSGNVYIATYWREQGDSVPQYHLVYQHGGRWKALNLAFRKTVFSLSGMGTRRIPVSRPQVIACEKKHSVSVAILFRDAERGNKVSAAICDDLTKNKWTIKDLTSYQVGSWEPGYDTELWKEKNIANIFVQNVEQADAEGISQLPPQMIRVLEWRPGLK